MKKVKTGATAGKVAGKKYITISLPVTDKLLFENGLNNMASRGYRFVQAVQAPNLQALCIFELAN